MGLVQVIATILSFFSPGTLYALGAVVVAGFLAWVRRSGVKAERARVAKQEAKARTIADEIDDAVAGREPAKNREELKRW